VENDLHSYQLQIARDKDFREFILETEKNHGTEFSPASQLPQAQLFWRVASVDNSGVRGPYSRTGSFTLRTLPETPQIHSVTFDLRAMQVKWSAKADELHYHFQMATDSHFENIAIDKKISEKDSLSLQRPSSDIYYYRTRAINSHGEASPFSKPEMIHIIPIRYNNPDIR
jgi:hypothetical protein